MRWSANYQQLRDVAVATGRLPQALADKPNVDEGLEQYVQAFSQLSNHRDAQGNLRFRDCVEYARILGDDPLEFTQIMSKADRAFKAEIKVDRTVGVDDGS